MRAIAITLSAMLLLLSLPMIAVQGDGDYKVIVHPSNVVDSVRKDELSKLFLKKSTEWSDGRKVLPVDLPENAPERASFTERVHGKSVAAVAAYWRQMVFSGRLVPPPEKSSRDVVAYVQSNPGAVGYVPASEDTGSCRIISIQ